MADQNDITAGTPKAPEPEERLPSDAPQAQTTTEDFRSVAKAFTREYQGKADELWNYANDRVRQHPAKAILSAIGVGFVLGLIFRR